MPRELSESDAKLLNLVQEGVPLVPQPFAEIGRQIGLAEGDVLKSLRKLKSSAHPIIRQISAIFDTRALGYRSSLVAARLDPGRIDNAARIINAHPGVSHNYQRDHAYNLWYTLAVPPDSKLGLEKTLDILHRESGAIQTRLMPTLKLFKIGVRLHFGDGGEDIAGKQQRPRFTEEDRKSAMAFEVTDEDKRMIRVLQQDLELIERPYDAWATQAGVSLDVLLAAAKRYECEKRMRRFSAVLHHREAGFESNGMGVWVVAPEKAESFGEAAARFSAVSHCYLRPTYEDWPYNIFTMVHAPSKQACDKVLKTISDSTGETNYAALYSSKEYKKVRVRYFTPDVEKWEAQHR